MASVDKNMTISSNVHGCILEIFLQPSDRSFGNYGTQAQIDIKYTNEVNFHTVNLITNGLGLGTYNFCANSIYPNPSSYHLYVKGVSHLRRKISSQNLFSTYLTTKDFRVSQYVLIAGEINSLKDNKVNSLDISAQILKLNTSDTISDLNKDGIVNETDLEITRKNFFLIGD